MADQRPEVRGQQGQGRGDPLVEGQGAEGAPHHQQPRGPLAMGQTRRRRRQGGDGRAHRVATGLGPPRGREALRKGLEDPTRQARQPAIGQSRHPVLLLDDQGDAQQPGHEPAGARGKTAHSQHQIRPAATQDARRLPQGQGQLAGRGQQGQGPLAAQALDPQPFDGEPLFGHQAGLHAVAGADPEDLVPLGAQPLRHRQGGKDMTAGTPGHDG